MTLPSQLAGRSDIWRGSELPAQLPAGDSTGYPDLDAMLAGGGWPRRAVTELISASAGDGALELLLPVLARLSASARWIALVGPPLAPFAPGFAGRGIQPEQLLWLRPSGTAERLWALEQALRSGACSAVLGWFDGRLRRESVRRLQLAAEAGDALGFLLLPPEMAGQASAAALRLQVRRQDAGLAVEVLKRRGGWAQPARYLSCR